MSPSLTSPRVALHFAASNSRENEQTDPRLRFSDIELSVLLCGKLVVPGKNLIDTLKDWRPASLDDSFRRRPLTSVGDPPIMRPRVAKGTSIYGSVAIDFSKTFVLGSGLSLFVRNTQAQT